MVAACAASASQLAASGEQDFLKKIIESKDKILDAVRTPKLAAGFSESTGEVAS